MICSLDDTLEVEEVLKKLLYTPSFEQFQANYGGTGKSVHLILAPLVDYFNTYYVNVNCKLPLDPRALGYYTKYRRCVIDTLQAIINDKVTLRPQYKKQLQSNFVKRRTDKETSAPVKGDINPNREQQSVADRTAALEEELIVLRRNELDLQEQLVAERNRKKSIEFVKSMPNHFTMAGKDLVSSIK